MLLVVIIRPGELTFSIVKAQGEMYAISQCFDDEPSLLFVIIAGEEGAFWCTDRRFGFYWSLLYVDRLCFNPDTAKC